MNRVQKEKNIEKDFLQIYNKYKNDIYRLCFSYTKSITDSEDITQNVFLKYYKNKNKISNDSIKPWLLKVTINECKSYFLSSWYRKVRPFQETDEKELLVKNRDNELLDAILKLPKKERLIIHLYYYEDFKIKEISKLLNISESNVKVKLHRCRLLLKDLLEEE